MKTQRRRAATRRVNVEPISVWQALNQPIVEVSGEAARGIFLTAAVIMLAVWLAPYWGDQVVSSRVVGSTDLQHTTYNFTTALVAGALTSPLSPPHEEGLGEVPVWYFVAQAVPGDVAGAFAEGASEVLDISDPVSQIAEFYEPGAEAVWGAWLELMADPY